VRPLLVSSRHFSRPANRSPSSEANLVRSEPRPKRTLVVNKRLVELKVRRRGHPAVAAALRGVGSLADLFSHERCPAAGASQPLSPSQFAVAIAVLVAAEGTTALRAESVSWVARFFQAPLFQAPLFQAPLFQAPLPSCLANAAGLSESYLEGAAEFFSWFGAGAFGCTSGAPGEPAMGKTIPSQNGFKAEWMARAPPTAAGLRAIAAAC